MATPVDPDLPLSSLLPLRAMVITLEFTQAAHPDFFHQAALTAFLRFLAGSPENYDCYIRIDAPESARISYKKGDYYRFLLIGFAGAEAYLNTLLKNLAALPLSAPSDNKKMPFRNNCRLSQVQDAFHLEAVHELADLSAYGEAQLEEESVLWQSTTELHWQLLSPIRLLKDKAVRDAEEAATGKKLKGEMRYCRDDSDLSSELLLSRLHDSIRDLLQRRGQAVNSRPVPPELDLQHTHVFWVDTEYSSSQKPMGGMLGKTVLAKSVSTYEETPHEGLLSPAWLRLFILGQYTGLGQRTTFGWGRYQLQDADGHCSYRRPLPATSMLQRAMQVDNMNEAWRHVMSGRDAQLAASVPADEAYLSLADHEAGVEWEDLDDDPMLNKQVPHERISQDLQSLLDAEYEVPELRGYLIPKSNGGVRALAVPPIYDRVLQRCITQVLNPVLEKLMDRHSHGYRKGRSRITARYDIQAAWQAGYRWVFESDIKDFFDSVNVQRLEQRLHGIFGDDPVSGAIIQWMLAPVRFQGESIKRQQGLPQGSPLSPLMANLLLDDFDSDMEQAGFRMVRFADDFIVLCKSPEAAKQAQQAALASLEEHGLQLHEGKTKTTLMDDGFQYLGYLFVNDMALDISGTDKALQKDAMKAAPAHSWLAKIGEKEPSKLTQQQVLEHFEARYSHQVSQRLGDQDDKGVFLAVTGSPAVLSTRNKHLMVYREDKLLHDIAWNSLHCVMLFGNHQLTTQAMQEAMRHRVLVHLANSYGSYQGVITQAQAAQGHHLWLQQLMVCKDQEKSLYLSKELVGARLKHMKEVLRQRQTAYRSKVIDQTLKQLHACKSLESLRGLEGAATREYFQTLALILPEQWGFNGRNRRPPKDPFNTLLSLGYTVLYGYSESVIHSVGLLPWQGVYHQQRGRHAALASDLMEPFRHVVERTALTVLTRQQLALDDFTYSPAGRCQLQNKAKQQYLSILLTRWETAIRARGKEKPDTHFSHLQQQALSLKRFIRDGEAFQAWRIR